MTDFRKQTSLLCELVTKKFKLDPYKEAVFIFCNRKRTSIKVLVYDKNGFILAQKTLLNANKMKFEWPRNKEKTKEMSYDELMEKYQEKIIEVENLKLELNNLKRLIFGQKREYTPVKNEELEDATQCSLFTENEEVEYVDEELENEIMEKTEEITRSIRNKRRTSRSIF